MLNSELKAQLSAMVSDASLRDIPQGLLLWWPDVKLPAGRANDPPVGQLEWEALYALVAQASIVPGWVKTLGEVLGSLRDVPQDGPIPLCLATFEYAKLKKKVAKRIRNAIDSNQPMQSPPNSLSRAVKTRRTFFAGCLLPQQWEIACPTVRGRVFEIIVSRQHYLTNPASPVPDEIWVDTGSGDQCVQFGDRLTCVTNGRAEHTVKVRVRFGDKWLSSQCLIQVSQQAAAKPSDEIWPLSVPGGASGRGHVYRGANRSEQRRYFIMCEGFPGGYSAGYLVDNLNQHGLFDSLLANGIDVVTISLDNGLQAIQSNADVVTACIQKANQTGTGHFVGGVSMGGMISRYALLSMEAHGLDHCTAAYLSIDTPHKGSRTSLAVQWFAQYFENIVPRMTDMMVLLESPANQQFLPLWLHDGRAQESELRASLYRDYARMGGYPKRPHLYAIASGRGDGATAFEAGTPMVTWHGSALANARLTALGAGPSAQSVANGDWILAAGNGEAQLSVNSDVCWEAVAGSVNLYNAMVWMTAKSLCAGTVDLAQLTACTVPTYSALDADLGPEDAIAEPGSNVSPFDDYTYADKNLPHTGFTAEIRDWILNKVQSVRRQQTGTDYG